MTTHSYFTPVCREALAASIIEQVEALISNEWKDILRSSVENAGLPEFFDFDDDGEEASKETWDLLYGDQFIDLSFNDDGRKLELSVEFADNA